MAKARYRVVLTPRAERDLKAIKDRAVLRRLAGAIDALAINPRPFGVEPLEDPKLRAYRIRVGDYRILYTVDDTQIIVTVVGAGHRREIYRKR